MGGDAWRFEGVMGGGVQARCAAACGIVRVNYPNTTGRRLWLVGVDMISFF
jgi:hypothetical protein